MYLFRLRLQMSPNIIGSTFILAETAIADGNNNKMAATPAASAAPSAATPSQKVAKKAEAKTPENKPYELEIVWRNVGLFVILHSMALYGLYLVFAESAYWELLPGEFEYQHVASLPY